MNRFPVHYQFSSERKQLLRLIDISVEIRRLHTALELNKTLFEQYSSGVPEELLTELSAGVDTNFSGTGLVGMMEWLAKVTPTCARCGDAVPETDQAEVEGKLIHASCMEKGEEID